MNSMDNACKKCLYVTVCKGGCIANSFCTPKRATKHCLCRLKQN
jgi:radical SAM protein with 4Fe4S-binding SPASM domain